MLPGNDLSNSVSSSKNGWSAINPNAKNSASRNLAAKMQSFAEEKKKSKDKKRVIKKKFVGNMTAEKKSRGNTPEKSPNERQRYSIDCVKKYASGAPYG